MPIDTSIYSQLQPMKFESPMNALAQVMQVKGAQSQNRLAELTLGEKERDIAGDSALAGLLSKGLTPDEVAAGLASQGYGKQSLAYTKQAAEMAKQKRESEKAQLEMVGTRAELVGRYLGPTLQNPALYPQALAYLREQIPGGGKDMPDQFDPATVQAAVQRAMSTKDQVAQVWKEKEFDLDTQKFAETKRSNRVTEGISGANLGLRREEVGLKRQEIAAGGKAPAGYRWKGDVLEAIPGGPGDKLPESQQKQVVGVNNLSNAINEYRAELATFGGWDKLNPNARAKMGTKYNNMMLQAKEAYNLGVLNGPDLDILTNVITDPRSLKATLVSKDALDTQAAELDRMMQGVGQVSGKAKQPQNMPNASSAKSAASNAPKAGAVMDGYRFKGGNPADKANWEKM